MTLINEVIKKVSGELAGKREQFRISIESPVDNPETTIETFNRQFQLGKIEKEAVEWAWPLEAGDTIFCSLLSLLKQMIK
ncbi:MAG: hypothetical protein JRJ00_17465 [Deltaproteobacteria bacterium]|nr:hypothetical protein [Deltaproteobacteria bacterium]